jgi:hypothetical protein
MPKIVETDVRQIARGQERLEFSRHVPWIQWRPNCRREHKTLIKPTTARSESCLELPDTVGAQSGNSHRWQRNRSPASR